MDRRIERTRDAIYEAFGSLLKETPFEKISINNIADRANINRSTFYLHFVDKYELFDAYMNNQMQGFYHYSKDIKDIHDKEKVRSTLHFIFTYFENNKEFFNIMFRENNSAFFSKKFRSAIYKVISKRLSDDANNSNIQMQFQLQLRVSALVGTIEWWFQNNMPLSVDEITDNVLDIFIRLEAKAF